MSDVFDIYTVIFLVLAVFILVRLRSVLGTRTGNERPRDYHTRDTAPQTANENVIPMPPRPDAAAEPVDPALRWKGFAEDGTPVAKGLDDIVAADPTFEAASFVQGARAAYEMIVQAFAAGDTRTLKGLLAKDVFDSFAATIADRERRGETVESRFVSIDKAEIRDAEMRNGSAQIEIRFASQLVTATRDKDGNVVDGNAEAVTDVTDIWTFARDTRSRDPNWKLVSTEAA